MNVKNTIRNTRVRSSDGVELSVSVRGQEDAPVIVCVHGYPDNSSVWDGVADILADNYKVVAYDVRGTGASDKPKGRKNYRMAQLSADLAAVINAVSPDKPVHLLAHDWGSIQTWESVTSAHFANRIASYVSISGPSLDMAGVWLRKSALRARGPRLKAINQLAHSYYIFFFQLPFLPEGLWRIGAVDKLLDRLSKQSGAASGGDGYDDVPRRMDDCINGIELYRANALPHVMRPQPRSTDVPVLVIAPLGDKFVSQPLATQAPVPYVKNLRTVDVEGGHWMLVDQPEVIADLTVDFIKSL